MYIYIYIYTHIYSVHICISLVYLVSIFLPLFSVLMALLIIRIHELVIRAGPSHTPQIRTK